MENNLKLNKFVLYVSCFAIALFVFAYSVGEVKANDNITPLTKSDNNYTIPSYEGDALFICWTGGMDNNTFILDSVSSTNMISYARWDTPYHFLYVDYVLNPSVGTLAFTGGNAYTGCFLVENLETSDHFSVDHNFGFRSSAYSPYSLLVSSAYSENFFIFSTNNVPIENNLTLASSTPLLTGTRSNFGSTPNLFEVIAINEEDTSYAYEWDTSHNIFNDWLVTFNFLGGGGEIPIEDPTSGIVSYFMFEDSYRCAQNSTCIIRYKYNQNYIPEDTNEMSLSNEDYQVVATSTIESFSELGKTNGNSRITFEVASSTPLGGYWYYANAEEDTDSEWVFASPVYIQVFDGSIPDATYVWDTDEDISTLWGDSYTLACSTEEWAEADDANFFNMIRLKCHATKTTLDIFFGTLNVAKNVFLNIYESGKTLLKNMFPFNMIYKIKYQWDRSETLALPLDLALIQETTESGELSVKINKELLSSNEDIYWVLWGNDLWEENTEVKALFDFIRTLSKYFMYALFLLGLYKMGEDFFNEYMYENKLSSQRNSDWQYDEFKD